MRIVSPELVSPELAGIGVSPELAKIGTAAPSRSPKTKSHAPAARPPGQVRSHRPQPDTQLRIQPKRASHIAPPIMQKIESQLKGNTNPGL
jgi:hypothetical protein